MPADSTATNTVQPVPVNIEQEDAIKMDDLSARNELYAALNELKNSSSAGAHGSIVANALDHLQNFIYWHDNKYPVKTVATPVTPVATVSKPIFTPTPQPVVQPNPPVTVNR